MTPWEGAARVSQYYPQHQGPWITTSTEQAPHQAPSPSSNLRSFQEKGRCTTLKNNLINRNLPHHGSDLPTATRFPGSTVPSLGGTKQPPGPEPGLLLLRQPFGSWWEEGQHLTPRYPHGQENKNPTDLNTLYLFATDSKESSEFMSSPLHDK